MSSSDSSSFSSSLASSLAATTGAASSTGAVAAANASGFSRYSFTYNNSQQSSYIFIYQTCHLEHKTSTTHPWDAPNFQCILLIIWTARKRTYLLRSFKRVLSNKRNRNEILVRIHEGVCHRDNSRIVKG